MGGLVACSLGEACPKLWVAGCYSQGELGLRGGGRRGPSSRLALGVSGQAEGKARGTRGALLSRGKGPHPIPSGAGILEPTRLSGNCKK